ncbi:unnamed protein product [Spirodela intermedia]|uniref:Fe2OG dioxygenase domain-containing protein n=1 Tax=Spirodela intermedia TaxID=51605 RepID=A0A7I8ICM3_SPIIN|nr:unnamed protein product [Spirodela intermedia]CAA6655568.1 unnamed protein product [Spirodela intermedia]
MELSIIDLSDLHTPNRTAVLRSLGKACEEYGFFQVINHGVSQEVIRDMVDVSKRFFDLPFEERSRYMSSDLNAPVRCGTSFNQNKDRVFCWRDFLKLTYHPLPLVLPHWPTSPTDLREGALSYGRHIRSLFLELVAAVLEALGLDSEAADGVMEELKDGTQVMVANFFPPCPEPNRTLGMPPHSDFGFLTLLHQDGVRGLQIQHQGHWLTVEPLAGALVVNVGDHLEIFSNGRYRSVLHRVLVNPSVVRMSVASIHSFPAGAVVRPAPQVINEANPRRYKDTDFTTFLNHLFTRESKDKNFVESRVLLGPENQEEG